MILKLSSKLENLKALFLSFVCAVSLNAVAQTQDVKVIELHQAPGQFINTMPEADEESTQEEVCAGATNLISKGKVVSLGAYGGYLTIQFDHPVQNKLGSDFCVWGNGFYAEDDPVYGASTTGGSVEPGIVYVGVGDDVKSAEWYELAGSEYYTSEVHDFSITYHKPTTEEIVEEYIRWECSWTDADGTPRDSTGWHRKTGFHKQSYWPAYEGKEELTFKGGRLPNNSVDQSGKGTYWVQYRYSADAYGYADACNKNDTTYSSFDISWAVDKEGKHVGLKEVNFIRVMTGVFQYCGWLGETSTEVKGFTDLHLLEGYDDNPIVITPREPTSIGSLPIVREDGDAYYNLMGQKIGCPVKGQIYIHKGRKIVCR